MLFRPAQSFENIKFMDDKKINKKYKSNVFCNLLYHITEDKKKKKGSLDSFLVMNRRQAGDDKALAKNP